jgi:hypothetical protein
MRNEMITSHALKAALMGFSLSSSILRKEAKKQLCNMRVLSGSKSQHKKKHNKETQRPEDIAIVIPSLGDKLKPQLDAATLRYWNLEQIRKLELRVALRHAHLAYNFLRGNDYAEVEVGSYNLPDWNQVEGFVLDAVKHDPTLGDVREVKQRLARWIEEAQKYYVGNWEVSGKGSLNPDRPHLWVVFNTPEIIETPEKKVA